MALFSSVLLLPAACCQLPATVGVVPTLMFNRDSVQHPGVSRGIMPRVAARHIVAAKHITDSSGAETATRERPLGEVLEFLRLLWAINHGLNTTSRRMQNEFGITGQQRLVIRIIDTFPGLSAGELAAVLHIHPSTATGILQRLASRQLVERRADPSDARRLQLQLTAKGRRLTGSRVGTVEASVRRTLGRFNAADVQRTRQVLSALSSSLAFD